MTEGKLNIFASQNQDRQLQLKGKMLRLKHVSCSFYFLFVQILQSISSSVVLRMQL